MSELEVSHIANLDLGSELTVQDVLSHIGSSGWNVSGNIIFESQNFGANFRLESDLCKVPIKDALTLIPILNNEGKYYKGYAADVLDDEVRLAFEGKLDIRFRIVSRAMIALATGSKPTAKEIVAKSKVFEAVPGDSEMPELISPEVDSLLLPSEVGRLFKVDPKSVTRWAAQGKISAVRTLGGHRRYKYSEVMRLYNELKETRKPSE